LATEEGIVIRVGFSTAWVKAAKSAACESCSAKGFCDTAAGSDDTVEIEAINVVGANVNDRVTISFGTSSLLKVAFLVYMIPVLFLIMGTVLGDKLASIFNYNQSFFSVVVGLFFLVISFFFVKIKGNKMSKKNEYKPKIIKILKQR